METITLTSSPEGRASEEVLFWEDLLADEEQSAAFLDTFHLPPPVREAVLENQHFPEAQLVAGCMLLRLPIREVWNAPAPTSVTFLALPERLVTFNRQQPTAATADTMSSQNPPQTAKESNISRSDPLGSFRHRLKIDDSADIQDMPSLLAYLLDGIVDMNIRFFTCARIEAEALGERLDENPSSVSENDVLTIRRQVSRLASQFEDQFYSLTSLQTLHVANKQYPLFDTIKDIADAQGHLVRSILRLETRLRDLQQHCQYLVQQRTEQRLRYLTVLSAVYMPLTLITSLYGMNFNNMPELGWEYGYFAVLSGMGILAAALILLFQRKGWFR